MKKTHLLFIFCQLTLFSVFSQPCFPDELELKTQQQVDSFPVNYPDCTEILGDLFIWQNINSLDSLYPITSIGGDLRIQSTYISNFIGLNNLTHVGGILNISGNDGIIDYTGLESLQFIGDGFYSSFNRFQIDFNGLVRLDTIIGQVEIEWNESLMSLSGLENIEHSSISDLKIYSNHLLSDCKIQSLCNYLQSPNGSVDIYDNEKGCNNPSEIANQCGNTLPCLPFGNYYIFHQYEVDSFFMYYPECTNLEGNLQIKGDDIENLESLLGLSSISGSLSVSRTENLINFQGLDSLTNIGNGLYVGNWGNPNQSIENFKGLEMLTSVGDHIQVFKNYSLKDFTGLNSLKSAYNISILGNESLISLDGLESLDSISMVLSIESNNVLNDLTALNDLSYVGYYISIDDNDSLKSLAGIESVDTASVQWIIIKGNESLSDCAAQAICEFLADPTHIINISENMAGCNTRDEVEEACLVSVNDKEISFQLSVYPNPFTTTTTIEYNLNQPSEVTLTIFNKLGKQTDLIRHNQTSGQQQIKWNAESLPAGMYFYTLKTGVQVSTGKLLKID